MKSIALISLAVFTVATAGTVKHHPLSDEAIAKVNSQKSTWTAGKNFEISDWDKVRRLASGVLKNPSLKSAYKLYVHDADVEIPETFDSRVQWPNCPSIAQIRDQSACGACWAFGAVEAMSDRICIHSNAKTIKYISAEDMLSCCVSCGFGCDGGYIDAAWDFWQTKGVVTGGLYNATEQGCKAYSLPPCQHHSEGPRPSCDDFDSNTPSCVKQCDDGTSLVYDQDVTYGGEVYVLPSEEEQIQLEILKNGPVEAAFTVYDDFPLYKSGVYQRTSDDKVGGHAIKIIGWGVEEGVKYWLIANSWNEDWGDKGYFKFLRGSNHCSIESDVVASLPVLD